ncbi:MAG: ExbD/TolR family protein [Akkermansiaceae bacterium]
MARHKHIHSPSVPDPQIDVSSMIDVCFLLLIYFLATMTITPRESDLVVSLPSPDVSDPNQTHIEPMFIGVAENGTISTGLNEGKRLMDTDPTSRELPLLMGQLVLYRAAAQSAGDTPVVQLWVDPRAVQQRVVDVLNTLAAAGIVSVTFTDLLESV